MSARGIRREKCVKIRHLHLKNKPGESHSNQEIVGIPPSGEFAAESLQRVGIERRGKRLLTVAGLGQRAAFEIDEEFLKYAKPKTAVIAGDNIKVAEDVTSDMLAEKISHLAAGDNIVCHKAASGFVRANSTCGDEIIVKG